MKPGTKEILTKIWKEARQEAGAQDGAPRWMRIVIRNLLFISILFAIIGVSMIIWYSSYDFTDRWQKEREYIREILGPSAVEPLPGEVRCFDKQGRRIPPPCSMINREIK